MSAPEQARVIRWEEPPPSRRSPRPRAGRSRYSAMADELRSRPGQWALVFEGSSGAGTGLATHIRLGQARCFTPSGDFDAECRQFDGTVRVYARYLGED